MWLTVYSSILRTNQFLASRMITLKPSVFYGFNKSTEESTVTYVIHVQYRMQQAVQHKTFSFKSKRIAKISSWNYIFFSRSLLLLLILIILYYYNYYYHYHYYYYCYYYYYYHHHHHHHHHHHSCCYKQSR